jgi:hypothetical protein
MGKTKDGSVKNRFVSRTAMLLGHPANLTQLWEALEYVMSQKQGSMQIVK